MFEIDSRQLHQLVDALEDVNAKGIKFAQRNTVNDYAFKTAAKAKQTIREEFTIRNTWTQRSIRVDKANRHIDSSEVGSTQEYMREQEYGATTPGPRNVPTPAAAGQSSRARKRTRPVRQVNRMSNINLKRRSQRMGGLTRKQQNIAAVRQAADEGRKYVYLDRGRTKGIFRLFGGKRRPRTRLVQDLSRRVRVVPKHPWLTPSTLAVMQHSGEIYWRRLTQQLNRASLPR